jgi:hypothetical protein
MDKCARFILWPILFFAVICSVQTPLAAQQALRSAAPKDAIADKTSGVQPIDLGGDWQMTWQGRLGAEQCVLHLRNEGGKLTGTFHDLRGDSPLSGTIDGKRVSFDVQFPGPRPFTTRFIGTAEEGKIAGTSQAVGLGGTGGYLGHAGEVVQPEHPWTAKRVVSQPMQPGEAGSTPDTPAKN